WSDAAAVLVRAVDDLVAGLPVEAVREDVHPFGRAPRDRDLLGARADELRDAAAHDVQLRAAIVVRRVFGDLAEVALVRFGDDARYRTFGAVVHEGHAVDDVELAANLPPERLVGRSAGLER